MDQKYIYFEKQLGGMLCGVHCINSLLQGPYFDEISMSQIAVQLDQEERDLLGGDAQAALAMGSQLKSGQTSHNVANDGNFSIQVLKKALVQFGKIDCEHIENPNIKASIKDYADEEAFICHSVDHWLAIRKIEGVWYNLNSTNIIPPGPQIISNFYLSVFLDSIINSGYTIFVVRERFGSGPDGKKLPLANKSNPQFSEHQMREGMMYIKASEIMAHHNQNKNAKLNVSG